MPKEKSYGLCIYQEAEGKVYALVIQPRGVEEYGFPKGRIEPNETEEECSIREVFEETGIIVHSIHLQEYFEQKNKKKDIGVFLVNILDLDMNNKIKLSRRECQSFKFIDISDNSNIHKNQKHLFEQIDYFFKNKD